MKIKKPTTHSSEIQEPGCTLGQALMTAGNLALKQAALLAETIMSLAERTGAQIVKNEGQVLLEKQINGKTWPILSIDKNNKTIDVVVDVKTARKASTATGITERDIQVPGYTIRQIHEVRGPMSEISRREIVTKHDEHFFVDMVIRELALKNGDIVRYNTWNFGPYTLYKAQLSEETILCESPEHKRMFILQLADDYCVGKTNLENKLSPEIKGQLRKIHETRKAPAYLSGYEIHHDGYGNMFLLPKEIHCRKLAHIGGSYLMNTQNYAVYIDNRTIDESVRNILSEELTADKITAYDNLTIDGKEHFISSIGNRILCNMGLADVKIEFADLPQSNTCGFYCDSDKRIVIDRCLLENPYYALLTELHEIRHAIQHDAVRHPDRYGFSMDTLNKWTDNIKYYIKPELDYKAYTQQPIEMDAESWALETLSNQHYNLYV